jgi:hypothetical protein
MLTFSLLAALSLLVVSFQSSFQSAGILFIESFGSYTMGRWLIRDQLCFERLLKSLRVMLLALLPFALFETLTNEALLIDALRPFFDVIDKGYQAPRLGLHRAQVAFEHPILYGAFASSLLGLAYYSKIARGRSMGAILWVGLVSLAAMFSISGGALAALLIQYILIIWDRMTVSFSRRWWILALSFIALYIAVDMLSNRTPFHVIVSYLTFSTDSAYNRIRIWQYGSASVLAHPFFGIGLGDWERPPWMSSSVDNFWLLIAMRYGLPSFIFLALAVVSIVISLGKAQFRSSLLRNYRAGLLVSLGGLIVAGCTVDYWNAIYCWFLFLLGSGMWMLREDLTKERRRISTGRMVLEQDVSKTTRNPHPFLREIEAPECR